MSDIRDFFIKTLDQAESGVNNIMNKFMGRLRQVDRQVYDRLAKQDIKPQFFAFRSVTL